MSIKKKKRPVLGYLPINVDNNSSSHNNTLNVSSFSIILSHNYVKINENSRQQTHLPGAISPTNYLFLNLLLLTTKFLSIRHW